eukprot:1167021-Prymnesium_polylepis.1
MLAAFTSLTLAAPAPTTPNLAAADIMRHRGRMLYNNTVLPQNDTFHQQFAMVVNPHYGLHVFARGANGSLFHMFQTSDTPD